MYKVSLDNQPEMEVILKEGIYYLNNSVADFDIVSNSDGSFHALYKGKSYHIRVNNHSGDILKLEMNNRSSEAHIKNDLKDLLTRMGMDNVAGKSLNELKAPMPGMVLKLFKNAGEMVKKGDSLVVLEAMKMENNIKAPGDGTVLEILVKAGDKVEKNQVMIKFK